MTTQGYDARAIKLPKSVKRVADRKLDKHARGAFIRAWIDAIKSANKPVANERTG